MGRLTRWQRFVAIGLMGIFFAQMVTTVPQLSLTADEPVYMGAGYAFLRSGDSRLATSAQHPPLMQELVALPLLLQPGPNLAALEGWDSAEMVRFAPAFVSWYGDALDAATFAARLPVVGVALLWAAFLFRWAADWFGPWGGLAALTLFVFDPNILAHATLATNDVGFAAFSFIALFAATRLLRRLPTPHSSGTLAQPTPLRWRSLWSATRSGTLPQPAPHSSGTLAQPAPLRWRSLWSATRSGTLPQPAPHSSGTLAQPAPHSSGTLPQPWRYVALVGLALGGSLSSKSSGFFTVLVLVALLLLDAVAHGPGRARRVGRAVLLLAVIITLGLLVLWATYGFELRPVSGGRLPVPMATQWEVWRAMREHLAEGHTSYLLGQIRDSGWLAYYPLAFVLKTPPFTLVLLTLGLVAAVAAGPRRWLAMLPLWIYLGGYVAATLLSSVGTGYRFLLPVLPLAFLLIAGLFRKGRGRAALHWGGWATLTLLGIIVAARSYPHYLTYFNFLAGGPLRGHRYLVDSNLDWGQSFRALQAYLDEQGIEQVRLSHYVYADPALYGVRYQPLPPSPDAPPIMSARFNPAPGVYAIGATTLQGVMVVDPDLYSWFRQREPVARPGDAIFVYRVTEQDPRPGWLAQCSTPVAPLAPEVTLEGFGRDDLRLAYFDCTQSWLYPAGGETPGWYALIREMALEGDRFIKKRLGAARLSYEQRSDRESPAFVIYEQPVTPPQVDCSANPRALDGPLQFLGHTVPEAPAHPGGTIEIETCWQVTALPARPLSLMLHLVGPDGRPVTVGDGLGVPVESWQVGDVLVQRHRLALPADAPTGDYGLYTGAYWLDTLERWVVLEDGAPAGDRVVLSSVSVVASR